FSHIQDFELVVVALYVLKPSKLLFIDGSFRDRFTSFLHALPTPPGTIAPTMVGTFGKVTLTSFTTANLFTAHTESSRYTQFSCVRVWHENSPQCIFSARGVLMNLEIIEGVIF